MTSTKHEVYVGDDRDDRDGKFIRIRPRLGYALTATRALRRARQEQDLDEEYPARVLLSGRADRILARARDLAADDREDGRESQRQRFALLGEFVELPVEDAWRRLVVAEPRLADLEGEVRAGRFSRRYAVTELHTLSRDEAQRVAIEPRVGS